MIDGVKAKADHVEIALAGYLKRGSHVG